jgi:hypothetical protein
VTKGELTKFKLHVRKLIDARPNATAVWAKLTAAFEQLKAESFARAQETGVGFRWKRGGERDLYAACEAAGAEEVILTGVALAYMTALDDRRFMTGVALFCTAGRRLRLLSPEVFTSALNPSTGRVHRAARDCSQRQLHHVGTRLLSFFGGPGLALREAEVKAEKAGAEARTAATKLIYEGTNDAPTREMDAASIAAD